MPLTSFPDLLGFSQRTRITSDLKSRLETVSQEAVTGIKADLTKAAGGRVGDVHLLQKALADVDLEDRINTLASSRIDLITQGLSNTRAALNDIDTRALVALTSQNETAINTISEEASINLENIMNILSARQGTRNLFSGNATDTPPYADTSQLLDDVRQIVSTAASPADLETALDTYFDDPAGGFNTDIYQGATSGTASIHLSGGDKIDIDIRGDSTSIKDVLRGLSLLATAGSSQFALNSSEFEEIFSAGISSTGNGKISLINAEANMGLYAETIEKLKTRNQAERISLTTSYQALVGRDQFEAATELKQLEVQLESSYVITSRLSNLSLINFLR